MPLSGDIITQAELEQLGALQQKLGEAKAAVKESALKIRARIDSGATVEGGPFVFHAGSNWVFGVFDGIILEFGSHPEGRQDAQAPVGFHLTTAQRIIIWVWIMCILGSILMPPWRTGGIGLTLGYSPIFHPPNFGAALVDQFRLAMEWIAITVVLAGVWITNARANAR
jgi:hypothetical protein